MPNTLTVKEIFFSIQGESSFAGRPCVFVRLAACDLRCRWCDTDYAFSGGRRIAIASVIRKVSAYPTDLVEVTGGEPLLQPSVHDLISNLLDLDKTVLVETGGHRDISAVDPRAILIYDIKCPDSGMAHRNLWENLPKLRRHDEVKFVIASRRDYEWAKAKVAEFHLESSHTILFSPVWGEINPRELAEWLLQDGLKVKFQLQLHKLLWGPDARGV